MLVRYYNSVSPLLPATHSRRHIAFPLAAPAISVILIIASSVMSLSPPRSLPVRGQSWRPYWSDRCWGRLQPTINTLPCLAWPFPALPGLPYHAGPSPRRCPLLVLGYDDGFLTQLAFSFCQHWLFHSSCTVPPPALSLTALA